MVGLNEQTLSEQTLGAPPLNRQAGRERLRAWRRVWGSCLSAALLVIALPAQGSIVSEVFEIRNWKGAAYLQEARGEFSHCAIYMDYPQGTTLYVSLSPSKELAVSLADDRWNLTAADTEKITLSIDRAVRAIFPGRLETPSMLVIDIGSNRNVADALATGRRLIINTASDSYSFDLQNSSPAMERLRQCVALHSQQTQTSTLLGTNPKPTRKGQPRTDSHDRLSLGDVASLLDHAGLQYRFLTPDDVQQLTVPFDYAWQTEQDVFGALVQIPRGNNPAEVLVGAFIASLNRNCRGEYGMDSRPAGPDEKAFLRRAISSCIEPERTTQLFYTIISGPSLVTLVLSYAETSKLAAQIDEKIMTAISDLLWPHTTLH